MPLIGPSRAPTSPFSLFNLPTSCLFWSASFRLSASYTLSCRLSYSNKKPLFCETIQHTVRTSTAAYFPITTSRHSIRQPRQVSTWLSTRPTSIAATTRLLVSGGSALQQTTTTGTQNIHASSFDLPRERQSPVCNGCRLNPSSPPCPSTARRRTTSSYASQAPFTPAYPRL